MLPGFARPIPEVTVAEGEATVDILEPSSPIDALPKWEQVFLAARARSLLRAGVPLSLLVDLADPAGPDSSAVYAAERADTRRLGRRVG